MIRHPDCTTPEACQIEFLAQPFPAIPVTLNNVGEPVLTGEIDMILGSCTTCDRGWTVVSRPSPPDEPLEPPA